MRQGTGSIFMGYAAKDLRAGFVDVLFCGEKTSCCGGTTDSILPLFSDLSVDEQYIPFPIVPLTFDRVVKLSDRATTVGYEIDGRRIHLQNRSWESRLTQLIKNCQRELNLTGSLQAKLSKGVLIDKAGTLDVHGGAAVLLVVFPSQCQGGAITAVAAADGQQSTFRFDSCTRSYGYVLHFASDTTEIAPIVSGSFFALSFDLIYTGAPSLAEISRIRAHRRDWIQHWIRTVGTGVRGIVLPKDDDEDEKAANECIELIRAVNESNAVPLDDRIVLFQVKFRRTKELDKSTGTVQSDEMSSSWLCVEPRTASSQQWADYPDYREFELMDLRNDEAVEWWWDNTNDRYPYSNKCEVYYHTALLFLSKSNVVEYFVAHRKLQFLRQYLQRWAGSVSPELQMRYFHTLLNTGKTDKTIEVFSMLIDLVTTKDHLRSLELCLQVLDQAMPKNFWRFGHVAVLELVQTYGWSPIGSKIQDYFTSVYEAKDLVALCGNHDPTIQSILQRGRDQLLYRMQYGPPPISWAISDNKATGYPEVDSYLQSKTERELIKTGFRTVRQAKTWRDEVVKSIIRSHEIDIYVWGRTVRFLKKKTVLKWSSKSRRHWEYDVSDLASWNRLLKPQGPAPPKPKELEWSILDDNP